jgi:hypothetical protein
MASYVGPAVTNTFLPVSGWLKKKLSLMNCMISSGSAILPSPYNPLANSPLSTGIIVFPKDCNC